MALPRLRRHTIRLRDYDYAQAGADLVTIVTQGRECAAADAAVGGSCWGLNAESGSWSVLGETGQARRRQTQYNGRESIQGLAATNGPPLARRAARGHRHWREA